MKGDFEQAVNNNEISAYLKGEGDYFAANEWSRGYHNYMTNWMGMMPYLREKENSFQLLVKYFKLFLSSLEDSVQDAWSLIRNISCYYILRNYNDDFSNNSNDLIEWLDDKEKQKIGRLFRLVRDNFDKIPDSTDMRPFDVQIEMVKSRGCPYDFLSF